MNMEEYTRSFSSFSGADIVATFHGRLIGELQAITYSVVREVAPIYTMGNPDPRSFSRGKRGISGSLIFTQFDRDALMAEMKKVYKGAPPLLKFQQFKGNDPGFGDPAVTALRNKTNPYGIATWDDIMTNLGYQGTNANGFSEDNITDFYVPEYADQLMPFNITITMANEYGQRAGMEIYGVQILQEGSGYSVDDVVSAKAYSFVARKIKGVEPKKSLRTDGSSSANVSGGQHYNNTQP
jgi:hypothetical protein